jgi:hypothetical protein
MVPPALAAVHPWRVTEYNGGPSARPDAGASGSAVNKPVDAHTPMMQRGNLRSIAGSRIGLVTFPKAAEVTRWGFQGENDKK